MVKSCCAIGCTNRLTKGSSLSFYRFPTDTDRRRQWIAAIRRKEWEPNEYSYVCSAHFISGKKSNDSLSPDFVPSIFKHVDSPLKRKKKSELKAYARRKQANRVRVETLLREEQRKEQEARDKAAQEEAARALTEFQARAAVIAFESRCVAMQTELSGKDLEGMNQRLHSLSRKVTIHSENVLTKSFLESNNSKVPGVIRFYTGLPSYSRLKAVFDFVSSSLTESKCSSLPLFQQFLIALMKLRLNVADQDIAYRFGISQSAVSKNFRKWVNIMYIFLKPLIVWPRREEVMKTMPENFKREFSRCICIIDCFEVFCERPSDLMARAQTFSNYKHHNTIKFLIGITPQGVISFVSRGWGGRVSDKHLTENCGLLNHLQPGDQVLADRGFTVEDSVGLYCAEIKVPPFTRGKKQLSRLQVDKARQLSRVRIHVERVIGVLRQKYTILESTLPINMIMCEDGTESSMIDKIVVVCCTLCNVCDAVVPFI